jgi:hypothetical protein
MQGSKLKMAWWKNHVGKDRRLGMKGRNMKRIDIQILKLLSLRERMPEFDWNGI